MFRKLFICIFTETYYSIDKSESRIYEINEIFLNHKVTWKPNISDTRFKLSSIMSYELIGQLSRTISLEIWNYFTLVKSVLTYGLISEVFILQKTVIWYIVYILICRYFLKWKNNADDYDTIGRECISVILKIERWSKITSISTDSVL